MLYKKIATLNVGIKSDYNDFYKFPDFLNYPDTKLELDVEFNLKRDSFDDIVGVRVGNFVLGNGVISFTNNNYQVKIDYQGEKVIVTACILMTKKQAIAKRLDKLYRLYSYEYESIEVRLIRGFIYYVINPVLQMMFVRNSVSFIHGSTISYKDNKAYLFTGWGGSGKTSTSSSILFSDDDYKFMSDDLAIIDSDKSVYNNPAISHIYPYNVVGFEELEKIVKYGSTKLESLHWDIRKKYLGINKVRRRIDPALIYKVNNNKTLQSSKVFYFMRYDGDEISHQVLNTSEAVNVSINVTNFEVKGIQSLHSFLYSIPSCDLVKQKSHIGFSKVFGSYNDYNEKLHAIYSNYFESQTVWYIKVPKKTAPKELKSYLIDKNLI